MIKKHILFFAFLVVAVFYATATEAARREVIGYFPVMKNDTSPYWTLADHSDSLSVIAPTWLSYTEGGKLQNDGDPRMVRFAHRRGLKVTPLVANRPFKPETALPVFADAQAIAHNVALLLKAVQDLGADGINVDLEGIPPSGRGNYNAFIEALCVAFHGANLTVTADVPAKTHDDPTKPWGGFADYQFLGKHLDQIHLMLYDEHYTASKPGPVGSIPWVRRVLDYAVTVIPRRKLIIGIPFYGYDWPLTGPATTLTSEAAQELIKRTGQSPRWDAVTRASWFTYTDASGNLRTVYYEDARSLKVRLQVAREYGAAGVAIWRLGDETPDFWPAVKRYRTGK